MRHYVDVTDADFERAAKGTERDEEKVAQIAAQQAHAGGRTESQSEDSSGDTAAHRAPLTTYVTGRHAKHLRSVRHCARAPF